MQRHASNPEVQNDHDIYPIHPRAVNKDSHAKILTSGGEISGAAISRVSD